MVSFNLFVAVIALIVSIDAYIIDPGPVVKATKGEVWPKPQSQAKGATFLIVRPSLFRFQTESTQCQQFLEDAFTRYLQLISNEGRLEKRGRFPEARKSKVAKRLLADDSNFVGYLDSLYVALLGDCPDEKILPDFGMSENYTLTISDNSSTLLARSVWGVLRGLETFSQSIYFQEDSLLINTTTIVDYPRFPHRGLLLDTSRHFLPVYSILQTLDAMAYNKLNVFHWHITDDHSFPYKSIKFPELSEQGSYNPVSKVYEQSDIQKIIEYARLRGIRVVPEFDTPGHTRSWGVAYPELLTPCYNGTGPTGQLGPMDPTKDRTYEFLKDLFTEVVEVFPDSYFHIGGDEVGFECWQSNPHVTAFMKENNITKYEDLESYFIQKLLTILEDLDAKYIVWEEVFLNKVQVPNNTVVHVWTDSYREIMSNVTKSGKFALLSSCWYLDHLSTGGDWQKFYICDPYNFNATDADKQQVLGGEACMWSESVNEYNVISRVWPRASAAAEKLWSPIEKLTLEDAKSRLEEHTCRMNNRGIAAQPPNGPGVCL